MRLQGSACRLPQSLLGPQGMAMEEVQDRMDLQHAVCLTPRSSQTCQLQEVFDCRTVTTALCSCVACMHTLLGSFLEGCTERRQCCRR